MTGYLQADKILRQLSTGNRPSELILPYRLTGKTVVFLGRDPTCQVVLNAKIYKKVSRRHSVLRWTEETQSWEVCDLDSVNGTYLNGQFLECCQMLKIGDHIQLGQSGPEFVFENFVHPEPTKQSSSLRKLTQADTLTLTQIFPLASMGQYLAQKAYFIPVALTVFCVVAMFGTVGNTDMFNRVLAAYLGGIAYYYVYRLCGKAKPWWLPMMAGLTTVALLLSPVLTLFTWIFRDLLPGSLSTSQTSVNFVELLVKMFFGAGLMEELLKAIPVLLVYWIGKSLSSPWRERIGIWEPLDGILIATASAVGFTLLETLGQYVPDIVAAQTVGEEGQLLGLQLLIPRVLGSVAGHMAYSGYFGYFIGLSILKPRKQWRILLIGYLSSSLLHGLWNVTGYYNSVWLAIVGVTSYAFLAAAILKARAMSPTRSQNFATRLSNH